MLSSLGSETIVAAIGATAVLVLLLLVVALPTNTRFGRYYNADTANKRFALIFFLIFGFLAACQVTYIVYGQHKQLMSINSYNSCLDYDGSKALSNTACIVNGKTFYKSYH